MEHALQTTLLRKQPNGLAQTRSGAEIMRGSHEHAQMNPNADLLSISLTHDHIFAIHILCASAPLREIFQF
jgi:hypothetical protein